jgi:hypothetical protein
MNTAEPLASEPSPVSAPTAWPSATPRATPGQRLSDMDSLDGGVARLRQLSEVVPEAARPVLAGEWLGHPLHPVLTDLAIGFWTSAWVLDLVGGRRAAPAATLLVGLGVASALPTAASGLVDWRDLDGAKQRVGVVHAATNAAATALYGASFAHRCRGHRGRGIATGMAAAAVATFGGYLGGHLVFGES